MRAVTILINIVCVHRDHPIRDEYKHQKVKDDGCEASYNDIFPGFYDDTVTSVV